MAARTLNRLSRVAGRPSLRIAVGLAVPPIEAWYLFQKNHQLGEAAWSASRSQGKFPQTKAQLKQQLYGKAPVSLARQTECAVQEAYRLVNSLDGLSACFPGGFGTLAKEVRSW
jgi:hypothetical protein